MWSALASGVLTGKYNEGIPDGTRLTVDSYQWLRVALESGQRHGDYKSVLAKVKALEPVAKELGCTQVRWRQYVPPLAACRVCSSLLVAWLGGGRLLSIIRPAR